MGLAWSGEADGPPDLTTPAPEKASVIILAPRVPGYLITGQYDGFAII